MDPCWPRSQAGQSSLCAGPKLSLVFIRESLLRKLTDKKGRSKEGWGARLKPYHHGGPHIELKPNSAQVRVEQQEI